MPKNSHLSNRSAQGQLMCIMPNPIWYASEAVQIQPSLPQRSKIWNLSTKHRVHISQFAFTPQPILGPQASQPCRLNLLFGKSITNHSGAAADKTEALLQIKHNHNNQTAECLPGFASTAAFENCFQTYLCPFKKVSLQGSEPKTVRAYSKGGNKASLLFWIGIKCRYADFSLHPTTFESNNKAVWNIGCLRFRRPSVLFTRQPQ